MPCEWQHTPKKSPVTRPGFHSLREGSAYQRMPAKGFQLVSPFTFSR